MTNRFNFQEKTEDLLAKALKAALRGKDDDSAEQLSGKANTKQKTEGMFFHFSFPFHSVYHQSARVTCGYGWIS